MRACPCLLAIVVRIPFRSVLAVASAHAGTATYLFDNSYAPVEATAPNLDVVDALAQNAFGTAVLYGVTRTVYNTVGTNTFSTNSGLTLDASSLITPTSYSLEMVVAPDATGGNGYRKLADVSGRSLDTGYDVLNQNLDVYNLGAGTAAVTVGAYNYLVLTVDDGTLKGYVNGALDFTFTGSTIMARSRPSLRTPIRRCRSFPPSPPSAWAWSQSSAAIARAKGASRKRRPLSPYLNKTSRVVSDRAPSA